jgi:hypothetical protein
MRSVLGKKPGDIFSLKSPSATEVNAITALRAIGKYKERTKGIKSFRARYNVVDLLKAIVGLLTRKKKQDLRERYGSMKALSESDWTSHTTIIQTGCRNSTSVNGQKTTNNGRGFWRKVKMTKARTKGTPVTNQTTRVTVIMRVWIRAITRTRSTTKMV